jgi:hypothetical protein
VCGSSARTDLYGGQLAIAVPTVTEITPIPLKQDPQNQNGQVATEIRRCYSEAASRDFICT